MAFDLDHFLFDCQAAVSGDPSHKGVREVVARAVREPAAVLAALGPPQRAGLNVLYNSPALTVLNLVWGPGMTIMPHDHRMWAVIGIYTGREDNVFWRRLPEDAARDVEAAGARSLCVGDCCALGTDIIHSVINPIPRLTRRDPLLRRGLPGAGTQRVGRGDAARRAVRQRQGAPAVRGLQPPAGRPVGLPRPPHRSRGFRSPPVLRFPRPVRPGTGPSSPPPTVGVGWPIIPSRDRVDRRGAIVSVSIREVIGLHPAAVV
jgi:hypothetical protein